MIFVHGLWGSGTSVVAATLEACGCYFGQTDDIKEGRFGRRHKHGMYEASGFHDVLQSKHPRLIDMALVLSDIITEAEDRALVPAAKLPVVPGQYWGVFEAAASGVVWVHRPTKAPGVDEVHADRHAEAIASNESWRRQHTCERQHDLFFEELLRQPAVEIERMCRALGLEYNDAAAQLVDPSWVRYKP